MKALSVLIVLIAVAVGSYIHERKVSTEMTNETVMTESL